MRRHKHEPVGSIHDDLAALAARVQRHILDHAAAWVDDCGNVHIAHGDDVSDIPPTWLLGIYSIGVTVADIEEDLRVMRRERRRDWAFD